MWIKELKRYLGLFLLGVLFIAVYKTFDNFGYVIDWVKEVLSLLTPFGIGICIAYVLYIPARKIEALLQKTKSAFLHKHRRGIAIAGIYLIFFAAVALLLVAIIPAISRSVREFLEQLPALMQSLFHWLNSFEVYDFNSESVTRFLNENILSLDKLLGSFTVDNVNRYAKGVISVGAAFFNAFMGIIVSVYILIDRHRLKSVFLRMFAAFGSEKYGSILARYGKKINEFIHRYISCQLVDALVVFLLSFLALAILRVKYAPLLALIVGTFNLIPYFGAIVATALAALITVFTKSFMAGLIVAVVLIVIQQVDANFIQPRLLSESLEVRPVWVILAIILGGGLFGILGIFLAVPFFALLRIILLDVLERREKMKEE